MVTGKRDFLSNDAKDLIREAGIFHIITISGVQMTLVAGIFFVVTRRLLALSPTLALSYPIKKWAAVVAMAGSLLYDVATGSRVGTERALIMTLIVLGAVIMDRRALTMRNLAFAVLRGRRDRAGGDPRRQLPALVRRGRGAGRGDGGAARRRWSATPIRFLPKRGAAAAAASLADLSRQAARAARRHRLRHRRHRLVHGLSLPRPQPLRADRQSADADRHRVLRRAGRAARRRALSARARRAGLALCRGGDQIHPLGGAVHRRGARLDPAPEGLRALRAAVPGARRDERDDLAELDVPRQRHPLRRRRHHRRDAAGRATT